MTEFRFKRFGAGGMLMAVAVVALVPPSIAAAAEAQPAGAATNMIGDLEKRLQGNTTDADGWRMLGSSYFDAGRYADAVRAYSEATRIDPAKSEYWSALGEATVLANNGGVTPKAEAALRKALAIDSKDARARYFIGVKKDMDGDHKGAVDDWIGVIRDMPPGEPWVAYVRALVVKVAKTNNIDITGRMPPPGV